MQNMIHRKFSRASPIMQGLILACPVITLLVYLYCPINFLLCGLACFNLSIIAYFNDGLLRLSLKRKGDHEDKIEVYFERLSWFSTKPIKRFTLGYRPNAAVVSTTVMLRGVNINEHSVTLNDFDNPQPQTTIIYKKVEMANAVVRQMNEFLLSNEKSELEILESNSSMETGLAWIFGVLSFALWAILEILPGF